MSLGYRDKSQKAAKQGGEVLARGGREGRGCSRPHRGWRSGVPVRELLCWRTGVKDVWRFFILLSTFESARCFIIKK